MINGQKVETGWMSQIQGIVVDKPGKLRGDRTDLLINQMSARVNCWKFLRVLTTISKNVKNWIISSRDS